MNFWQLLIFFCRIGRRGTIPQFNYFSGRGWDGYRVVLWGVIGHQYFLILRLVTLDAEVVTRIVEREKGEVASSARPARSLSPISRDARRYWRVSWSSLCRWMAERKNDLLQILPLLSPSDSPIRVTKNMSEIRSWFHNTDRSNEKLLQRASRDLHDQI